MLKHNLFTLLLLFSFIKLSAEIPRITQKDTYYERWQESFHGDIKIDLNNLKGEIPQEIKKNIECMQNKTGNCAPAYIFYGPPGNGKTALCKAIAKEVNGVHLSMTSGDFEGCYAGTGPKRVEHLFQRATQLSDHVPVVISRENIDGLVVNTINKVSDCMIHHAQTYNSLLNFIDSLPANNQIILIATTYNIDKIDAQLKHSGRAKIIDIKSPNLESRKAIIKHYVNKHSNTIKEKLFDSISKNSEGFCSAAFEAMAKIALVNGSISEKSLNEAFNKIAKIEKENKEAKAYQAQQEQKHSKKQYQIAAQRCQTI